MKSTTGLALVVFQTCLGSAAAQETALSADAAAGKSIFDRTDNKGGCIRCHGPDALGSEANTSLAGNNIQGRTAEETRLAIMALPMMWNIKISDDELLLVEAYLKHLLDAPG